MKATNLEAWQLYAARCRRLDAEEAKREPSWWDCFSKWEAVVMAAAVEAVALCWAAGMFK